MVQMPKPQLRAGQTLVPWLPLFTSFSSAVPSDPSNCNLNIAWFGGSTPLSECYIIPLTFGRIRKELTIAARDPTMGNEQNIVGAQNDKCIFHLKVLTFQTHDANRNPRSPIGASHGASYLATAWQR
jgi:hypothetical protein